MCGEINENLVESEPQGQTFEDKISAFKASLRKDSIILPGEDGSEMVTSSDEPSAMANNLIEYILPDDEGSKLVKHIVEEYPDMRTHITGAYADLNVSMSSATKEALGIGKK